MPPFPFSEHKGLPYPVIYLQDLNLHIKIPHNLYLSW